MPEESPDAARVAKSVMARETARAAEIAALIDEYCHRLVTSMPMDAATHNAILFGRDELQRRAAAVLEEK